MKSLRHLDDRPLRRARLLAARKRAIGSVPRTGILSGQWDGGSIVQNFMAKDGPNAGKEK
jgi:hypothetical protein